MLVYFSGIYHRRVSGQRALGSSGLLGKHILISR